MEQAMEPEQVRLPGRAWDCDGGLEAARSQGLKVGAVQAGGKVPQMATPATAMASEALQS